MKTKAPQTMESCYRQFFLFFIGSLFCFQGWSQGNVRVQIPGKDIPIVSDMTNGQLQLMFPNAQVNQLLSQYTISGFGKEFPMFQDEPGLKDIYYISYSGGGNLAEDLSNTAYFVLIENIGIGEVLSVPDDYTTPHPSLELINVPAAWNLTESTPGVKLGMIDLPVSSPAANLMPDLDPSVEYGTQSGYLSWNSHSDAVGSTMAAKANNGLASTFGISAGIGYNSRLYAGSGMITLNIQDQVARGARAINVSMAVGVCSGSPVEQLFYNKIAERKIIIVAAAGNGQIGFGGHIMNNGSTEYCMGALFHTILCNPQYTGNSNGYVYPAAYDNVISVSGLSIADNLYGNFSYNPNNLFDCDGDGIRETPVAGTLTLNDKVDVLAPPTILGPNGHGTTSFAAPVITGAIGLMLSVNPNLDINEVIEIFNQTGVNVSASGNNPTGPNNNNSDYFQNGNSSNMYKLKNHVRRIDVGAAVIEAKNRYDAWLLAQASRSPQLVRVNSGAHVNDQASSFSLNWIDYDNDNDLDIYNGTKLAGSQSQASGFQVFESHCGISADFNSINLAGFEANSQVSKIGWGDFDNDGDKDFVGYNEVNELIFYRNNGNSSFVSASIGSMAGGIEMRAGSLADFNTDGKLDFIVGPKNASVSPNYVHVYQGNGDGTFTLVTGNNTAIYSDGLSFDASAAGDINGDGNQDIAIAGTSGNDLLNLYAGNGNFGFTKITLDPSRVDHSGYGVNMVDYDNDTDLDLYFNCSPHGILFNNLNNGKFFYVNDLLLTNEPSASSNATWGDYDNDGDQDVYVPGIQSKTLYNNEKGIIFSQAVHEVASQASEANHQTGNAAFGDADNDGDLDLYTSNHSDNDLNNYYYLNQGNANKWIKLKLSGANTDFLGNGRKTSVSAEGTEVVAMMTSYASFVGNAGLTQTRYVQTNDGAPHDVHLGFGNYASQISVRIKWPSGLVQVFVLNTNQCYQITEGTSTYTNNCGCQDANPLPDAAFETNRSCDVLGMSYDFEYTGNTPDGASYFWNFGPNATPSTSTLQNPGHVEFSAAGTELVSLTITRYGYQKIAMNSLEVSSPTGCNGSPKKVMLCKNGNEVCVPLNAAASMIANGYCVGECDKTPNKNKSAVALSEANADEISLYPNPGNGLFHVTHSGSELPVLVTVMNGLGEVILVKSTDQAAYTVDLTREADGVYFFIIETNKNSYHYRAVKQ